MIMLLTPEISHAPSPKHVIVHSGHAVSHLFHVVRAAASQKERISRVNQTNLQVLEVSIQKDV